jgi:signal transduction histidine kinase
MAKLKLPKRLITTTILMALILVLIIGVIISLINEKGRIQAALNLSQQNREQLLKTESVTESLLLVEARFKEYCATFKTEVFDEYKAQVQTLAENIRLLQQTASQNSSGEDNRIANIFDEKKREAEVYLRLKQITDSLMLSVSNLEERQTEIEKTFNRRIGGRIDTLSVTETRESYKKGLLGKIKSAIVGEKIKENVNTKLRVQNPGESLQKSVQPNVWSANSGNIKELIRKNFELKESELKLIYINNSLIAEIGKFVDDIKISIKNQEASHNNSFLNSVRHSTDFLQNILIVLMILACILSGYILFLAYRNDKFQDHIMALNQKVMKDSIEKDKFFSIISHDLMNPFNALLGFSNILKDAVKENDQKEIEECSTIVNQSANRISNLLQNLLVWSRMHNGKIQFSPKSARVEELVSGTLMVLSPVAKNKDIKISWKVDGDIAATLDTNMIGSVLQNLVTNAIKFTKKGGEVSVHAFCESENLNFEVADTGVGMTDEQIQKLFRLDKTASSRGTDDEVGTGLGLVISKEFVEMHRGKIWVESTLGKGSKFCFAIPVAR